MPGVRTAELGRAFGICIPTTVTWHTATSSTVEPSAAAVTLLTTVPREALVTHWEPIRVRVTAASGAGVGAGAGDTGVCRSSAGAAVELGRALLTVRSLSVVQAVQTDAGLWVAVVGMIVALARLASRAAEAEEPWMAFVAFGAVHSGLTHTHS